MSFLSRCRLLLFLLVVSFGGRADLPPTVQNMLNAHGIPLDSLGVLVQPIGETQLMLAHNIDRAFNPASVIKLVTTYAALDLLGPQYRWKTEFYIDGPVQDGVLSGDLYVKGFGDPYLVEETLLPTLRSLRSMGLRHINGHLVVDNSYFEPGSQHPGEFDNRPYRTYNAKPSALMTNFQTVRFTLVPDTRAKAVDIRMWPESADVRIENAMQLAGGRCRPSYRWPAVRSVRSGQQVVARFHGQYSRNCGLRQFHLAAGRPPALFYGAFDSIWKLLGGTLTEDVREGVVPADARLLHTHMSKPLSDIIRLINKHSSNVMARQLMLTVAAEKKGAPGTPEKGREAITEWLHGLNIDTKGLYIDNGSGLSRDARISAQTLQQIMLHQWHSPWMPELVSSLSILGKDGTGRKRLRNSDLRGSMHLKTGLLDHVRTIAGFYHADDGQRYLLIALQNHKNIDKLIGTRIQDELIQWLDGQ